MIPISTTNTVESPAAVIDLGCALVAAAAGLQQEINGMLLWVVERGKKNEQES